MTTTEQEPTVVMPAHRMDGPLQGQWTYEAYASLPGDGRRYEVVNGVLYMAPAPNLGHQGISGTLFFYLFQHVNMRGVGRVFSAPTDIQLNPTTVVQPDIFVVLNTHLDRLKVSRVHGAPDLVVEIASPGTVRHDLYTKQIAYVDAGVPEYWIVTPDAHTIELLVLDEGAYRSLGLFEGAVTLPSQIMPDLPVTVEQLFAFA